MVINLCDSQGLWLRYILSMSYYNSRLNYRIFQKFTIYIIEKVNTLNPFYEYIIWRRLIILRQIRVLQRVTIIDSCNFPSL